MAKSNKSKSELSKKDWKIFSVVLIIFLTVVIVAIIGAFPIRTALKDIEAAQGTITELEPKVQEALKVPSDIAYYESQIAILSGQKTEDNVEIPELGMKLDVPTILTIIENSARGANLNFTSLTMDGNASYVKGGLLPSESGEQQEDASGFLKLGLSMQVSSVDYAGLMKFLENVEDAGYYVTTSECSLATNESGNIYNGTLKFYIYSVMRESDFADTNRDEFRGDY